MSVDKRSVSTDALETLGTIIDNNQKRDAIHLAVIPVVAAKSMKPGQHCKLIDVVAHPCKPYEGIGIVDPFLRTPVGKDDHFWLVIYPRVITSLRHVWTHPELPDELGVSVPVSRARDSQLQASEAWLKDWCSRSDISYEDLIEVSKNGSVTSSEDDSDYWGSRWSLEDGYLLSLGRDACGDIPSEVWDHVKNVIGQEPVSRAEYFSCSC